MSEKEFSQLETVKMLTNLDQLAASGASDARRAWAHIFIACGLIQRNLPSTEALTRERFMELAGKVHDRICTAVAAATKN